MMTKKMVTINPFPKLIYVEIIKSKNNIENPQILKLKFFFLIKLLLLLLLPPPPPPRLQILSLLH